MANFYPRPPRGGRRNGHRHHQKLEGFLSTPSARRATPHFSVVLQNLVDFYPRPPRGGRRPAVPATRSASSYFYPRPPRGGRPGDVPGGEVLDQFLSTPSARRATRHRERNQCDGSYFYPRPPRGGRPRSPASGIFRFYFYPRPPRGGRRLPKCQAVRVGVFLSTPSARRATIAVPGVGADALDFYPRPPRGGRRGIVPRVVAQAKFLSTPSARRATRSSRQR